MAVPTNRSAQDYDITTSTLWKRATEFVKINIKFKYRRTDVSEPVLMRNEALFPVE